MDGKEPTYFDLKTVDLLREILDEAWACLRPEQATSRTLLAERILKEAAKGERDPERSLEAALMAVPHSAIWLGDPAPPWTGRVVRVAHKRCAGNI